MLVVIVVLILVVVSISAYEYYTTPPPPIQVAFFNIWAPDNVCGLNANPISYYGYNWSTSTAETFEFPVPNFNATSCTIHSVVTNSTGFSLSAVQVPLTIAGNGTQSMNITVTSPGSSFSGSVNFVFA